MSNCKHRSQPDMRLSSNADHSQTRVSSQTRIQARPVSQFKHKSQPDSCFISKVDPSQTCISPQTQKISQTRVSAQTQACELHASTIEQNQRELRFCCNCPITGSIKTHIMWGVIPHYGGILRDNFTPKYPYK